MPRGVAKGCLNPWHVPTHHPNAVPDVCAPNKNISNLPIGTPRKINMEPENTPLEKEHHLPNHHFQVLC